MTTATLPSGTGIVSTYGAGLTSMKQSGNWFCYHAHALGSTMAIVDSTGVIQKSYQYDVYGEVTGGSGLPRTSRIMICPATLHS